MLKVFGHSDVYVLDDGMPAWIQAGKELEQGPPSAIEPVEYGIPQFHPELNKTYEQVLEIAATGDPKKPQILDARPEGRFKGTETEPRPGLSSGHMPDAVSVPFSSLLDPDTKKFLSRDKLRKLFLEGKHIDESRPVVASCGTGVTASSIYLALEIAGIKSPKAVYDGSWTEWASRADGSMIMKN